MDLHTVVGTAIRNKLLANSSIVNDVDDVFQFTAPGLANMPYMTFSWSSGGLLNNTPKETFDTQFLVTAIAETQVEARRLAGYIEDSLKNEYVDYPDGWDSWAKVTYIMPFMDLTNLQNIQFWRVGGFYRFRGIQE